MNFSWNDVLRRCDDSRIAGLGFKVAVIKGTSVLLREDRPQAYTPGGAIDVIEYEIAALSLASPEVK